MDTSDNQCIKIKTDQMTSKEVNHLVAITASENKDISEENSSTSRCGAIIRKFALNTTAHGLPRIARSRSKNSCVFWTVSFLIFTGIMIYFVAKSIRNYFEYPTQTSVSIIIERSQVFPAVTFCNYSPVRYDTFIEPFLNYTNSTAAFSLEQADKIYDFLRNKLNTNEAIDQYFFSLESMLIECLYNNIRCTVQDFTSFLSSQHGRCYTFNANRKDPNNNKTHKTDDYGGPGKLVLRLYANSHLYVPYISRDVSVGMIAMIHDNTQLPLIDVAGIELTSGQKHKLAYKKKTIQFLPAPYTGCTDKIPVEMQAMFDRYGDTDYKYSESACSLLCIQAYIYEQCKCVNPEEWSARSIAFPNKTGTFEAPLCNHADECYLKATVTLFNVTSLWNRYCSHCTHECSKVDFLITKSSTLAPAMKYASLAKIILESQNNVLPQNWSTNWLSEFQKNYVGLEVVCQSIEVEHYTQEASISPVDILSDVGGQTGLWIGISFLSLMEVIEMIYRFLRCQFHSLRRAIQNKIKQKQKANELGGE